MLIIRERTEKREASWLSPHATLSGESGGRRYQEKPCSIRTEFQRDRDRIIHSKAFRRLKHKTQVFISPGGDHYRTRLTHTLEVSQIARTVARSLQLNEDLTEAIALGHDLGHTPFGHAGESALDQVVSGSFAHNQQSLRVVDCLEQRHAGHPGLNLTQEVRDGIKTHTGPETPDTIEGEVVRIADRIAYINHDIDDSLRAGIISLQDLPEAALKLLGKSHSRRIDTMVRDLIQSSRDKACIQRSPEIKSATAQFRQFLFDNVYLGSKAKAEENKARRLIIHLFNYYQENRQEIPREFREREQDTDLEQVIVDYIAGMTDRYAINMGHELFIPRPWLDKNNRFLQEF
ncbi:MAG: deoxyguanosinetriphosphate triphosphohydrolase [Bacillota bacterium]